MDSKGLREFSEHTFTKRLGLISLWQEQAENFYPERADFTVQRYLGNDFAGNLSTSFPMICRRELSGAFATMLRPPQKDWFEIILKHGRKPDLEGRAWLQMATETQRKAMYDLDSLFHRAVVMGDNDFATFGQYVMSVRLNRMRNTLLYRTWHLRDVTWIEDDEGKICPIFRKWKPQARTLKHMFGDKNHPTLLRMVEKEPFKEIDCLHMIVSSEEFDGNAKGRPYWSIYYDCTHNKELEAVPVWSKEYVIPRWQTVSGSQYAYSPATVAALPDARLLQAMTYTLLEAGEKATNPPLIATEGAVRSDISDYAGSITWVDYEYDERLGEALRPQTIDTRGLPIGVEMQRDCRAMLKAAFFADKVKPFVPTQDPQMTAFQAGEIVAQYIRDALPIFEPMEPEVNGQICEITFDILFRRGAFGSPMDIPHSLAGMETQFQFQSPLHDAIDAQKGHKFLEVKQLLDAAIAMDRKAAFAVDAVEALRDALQGIKAPAAWMRSEVQVKQMADQQQQMEQTQQLLDTMQKGADAAKTTGEAAALQGGGQPPVGPQLAQAA